MTQSPQDAASARISGVFSQKKTAKIGTGTTARKTEVVTYFLVCERDDGQLDVQALTADDQPFGPKKQIGRDELLANYFPEPQKTLARQVSALSPKEMEIQKAVARGDKFRKRGESFTAEFEYNKALALDMGNVRANFGIGLCYIARGEQAKAREVFERVVHLDAAFQDEHKHLFNEFGINLRKAGMHDEAQEYYRRALDLSSEDENLHYNLARAAFGKGDVKAAAQALAACLALNPEHAEARQFVDYLKRKKNPDS
ncbi:Tetratricopeptide repeat-containing protein [Humidesulfovibrio mexicanus]|uniref:Tetratricopeptide repeat-containing protein n=1 Tax=Humidesulfovibrio mexicanus TaxID=147047 RepID=A0A239CNY0_9BACT|nr:tetratricopeptide repeat protein [Humidesulfovibrio mexicanus]SNS21194.1 Tetratricopeptide repeat-containing protein [Humidesulfovibrio mexicanus]